MSYKLLTEFLNRDHFEELLNIKTLELTKKKKRSTSIKNFTTLYTEQAMKNSVEIRAHVLYNAILVGILIIYGLFGACVFRKLEALNSASVSNDQLEASKEQFLKELWNEKSLEFDQWSAQARNKLDSYEKNFVLESSHPAERSLADSWLFACTIFTTIGKTKLSFISLLVLLFVSICNFKSYFLY